MLHLLHHLIGSLSNDDSDGYENVTKWRWFPLLSRARPLCVVGRLGRKKKRARGARREGEREKRGSRLFPLPIVPRAPSIFSIIAVYFYRDT